MTVTGAGVAIVTGAGGGIGRAVCLRLAADGWLVVGADLPDALARRVEGAGVVVGCDVTDPSQVAAAVARAAGRGRLRLLVTSAGVVDEAPLDELTDAAWRRVLSVCLDGTFHSIRAALPHLAEQAPSGGEPGVAGGASIVALSSGWAAQGYPDGAHYAAAKAGVEALVRSVAVGWGRSGVRANAVAPGPIDTPMLRGLGALPERLADRRAHIPIGRIGQPAEVAEVTAWLASPAASLVTGQVIHASGGLVV